MKKPRTNTILCRLKHGLVSLLFDWSCFRYLAALVLLAEAALSCLIVARVPYTEIDWIAYMQEVDGWAVGGDTDYLNLKGDTGPLVYPAGFLYIYRALQLLAGNGGRGPAAVRFAQWAFVGLYLATLAVVLYIYRRARLGSPWVVLLLMLSKRIHSLFMLRLFNDCVAMFIAYASVAAVTQRRWVLASALFSVALSVKMNVLLMAPGLLYLLVRNVGIRRSLLLGVLMLAIQVGLGWPFLATFPSSYLSKAFEMSRVFMYTWTVNLKFLSPDTFVSKTVAAVLLTGHLLALVALAQWRWGRDAACRSREGVWGVLSTVLRHACSQAPATAATTTAAAAGSQGGAYQDSASYCVWVLATSNFAGIVFARTLHYQFYTWYYHTLPLLLWSITTARSSILGTLARLAVLLAIEIPFNVGDAAGAARPWSSALLQAAHFAVLAGLLLASEPSSVSEEGGQAAVAKSSSVKGLLADAGAAEGEAHVRKSTAARAGSRSRGLRKRSASKSRRD